ncbi:helix-turn-helix domain-containing protein [Acinetobacter sp. SwsAc2]|uniref:GlxA family transcriptional regulator n=1 Tax=Acinetobacter sp. SwsAc2 TaxID=2749360 RepID=UPI0015B9184F|nr:helix-turn-helix domain-containing protein [Acinetobacter sp. SwsAc2]NWK60439.1 helix-turn-helix domain-containing protein [Acinetobacter sp. SwsAc2]NWK63985.1 helix-turn-helix domain-containing protein [Acinetobacter sp. SwsAc3]
MTTKVAVLAFEGVSLFHLSIPSLVFNALDQSKSEQSYNVFYSAEKPGFVRTEQGIRIEVDMGLNAISTADIVIIPAWKNPEQQVSKELIVCLKQAYQQGAILVGLCLGAFVLGEAGLLDGRKSTTHWIARNSFQQRFPKTQFCSNVLYIIDENIITSAGTVAAIDCCLDIIRNCHGANAANHVARMLVTSPHRQGGQTQYIERPIPQLPCEGRLTDVLEWARENLSESISVDNLANMARLSRRTFTRHFRAATGTTVIKWLNAERVARAQQLLETTDISIESVAAHVGFRTALSLRQHFSEQLNISPSAYRKSFTKHRD